MIDIRNNSGGFVNVYAIDVLARRGYLTMTLRGLNGTPARTVLGQRALNRPTILVTNQHLHRGKLPAGNLNTRAALS